MINKSIIMGRLTYEPELKSTSTGKNIINFQVACDRQYQANSNERVADFIDCQAWNKTAEFISRNFHKGDMIALEGEIQTDNYTDKEGNKRKSVIVNTTNVSFCGSKITENNGFTNPAPAYASADVTEFEEIEDDLPF